MVQPHVRSPLRVHSIRALLAVLVFIGAFVLAPSQAVASRLSTDRIGGIRLSSSAVATASAPDITARSGMLVGSANRVLWTRKAIVQRPMASTTKVMTALLTLERCSLDEKVSVTKGAAGTPYAIGLRAGERRTVRELLQLLLVASSNDAANALAIHVGGSRARFVRMMNARASTLGLSDTHYANAHGLDAMDHYTTARDLSVLMRTAVRHAEFRRIIGMRSVILPKYRTRPERRIRNTNELLGLVEGLRGGKTGYTSDARYCLVTSARRDGIVLTSVILGSPTSSTRFTSSRRLLEWGFKNYRIKRLCSTATTAGVVPVSQDASPTLAVRYASSVSIPVLKPLGPVTRVISLTASITVPVFEGQTLGVVRFVQNSSVIATAAVTAAVPLASVGETVGEVPVLGNPNLFVTARAADTTAAVSAFDATRPVERTIELLPSVVTPVFAGQWLGWITYSQDTRELVRVQAIAAQGVPAQ